MRHLTTETLPEYFSRIDDLSAEMQPLWGSMNAGQMLIHVNKLNRIALEKESVEDKMYSTYTSFTDCPRTSFTLEL